MYRNLEFFFATSGDRKLQKSLQFSISNLKKEISGENSPVNKILVSSNTYCDRGERNPTERKKEN
jgi:hypothetical protein